MLSTSFSSVLQWPVLPLFVDSWLGVGLPQCPWVVLCHLREIEPFSAMQDGLAECDQPGKDPRKYFVMAGNWMRVMERTDSEIHSFSHWTIMTDFCALYMQTYKCTIIACTQLATHLLVIILPVYYITSIQCASFSIYTLRIGEAKLTFQDFFINYKKVKIESVDY